MRILRAVVQPLVPSMLGIRNDSSNRRRVTRELVGDDDTWFAADAIDNLSQESLRSILIAALLDQDVRNNAVLIDCPPGPVSLAADFQQHLVKVPFVATVCSPPT